LSPSAIGAYSVEVLRVRFIPPALPRLRASPPSGEGWLFELKFDGWRVQLDKEGVFSAIYCKNGGDLTRRFPAIAAAVVGLPTRSCIIDGELIAAGRHGQPDFLALLHGRHVPTCVYAFDLLDLNERDLRELPLANRRARLNALLTRAKCNLIRFSKPSPMPMPCWRSAHASASRASCARGRMLPIVRGRDGSR
jgi:bifunctional non-homologous end joining protein LigD